MTKAEASAHFGEEWALELKPLLTSSYCSWLMEQLNIAYRTQNVYPASTEMFKAFRLCPPSEMRCVLLGEQTYLNKQYAHPLFFGMPEENMTLTYEMSEIKKKIESESTLTLDMDVTLESWGNQGVLLLNSAMTVEKDKGGHYPMWENFTKYVIEYICKNKNTPILTFGKVAGALVPQEYTNVYRVPHPNAEKYGKGLSSLQANVFSEANQMIVSKPGYENDYIRWTDDVDWSPLPF